MTHATLRFEPLGDRALLIRLGDRIDPAIHRAVGNLATAIRAAALDGITEVVPTYTTVGVWYDPIRRPYADLVEQLSHLRVPQQADSDAKGRDWTIPTRYDGPDLGEVANRLGTTPAQVIERHASRTYSVYLLGFVPGFAFLGELDPALVLPRRDTPRRRVPAGSVAIAGAQTGIYPLSTPGGWHLIGRTKLRLFDPSREPAALLDVGDRVRFDPVR